MSDMSDKKNDWALEVAADVLKWISKNQDPWNALNFIGGQYSLADVIRESVEKYHPNKPHLPILEKVLPEELKDQKKVNNNRPVRPVSVEWSKQDKRFLASINSLPGCMADGKTKEEAISNVRLIEAEWVKTAEELGWDIRAFDE